MKRLIKAEMHETVDINGKEVIIYNNPSSQESRDATNISPSGILNGLITNSDIYIWPGEFSANQIKSYIRDNFDAGYQFTVPNNQNIKIFKSGQIREDEIRTSLMTYYAYLITFIDAGNADLTIENYVDGEGKQDPSYTVNFNKFLNR